MHPYDPMGASIQAITDHKQPHTAGFGWPWPQACSGSFTSTTDSRSEVMASSENWPPDPASRPLSNPSLFNIDRRKSSVAALVGICETRDRTSRAPTIRRAESIRAPSPGLRNRYDTALSSRKSTISERETPRTPSRSSFRPEKLERVEATLRTRLEQPSCNRLDRVEPEATPTPQSEHSHLPVIHVETTPTSVTIHIPGGVLLPLAASIHSAGPFQTHIVPSSILFSPLVEMAEETSTDAHTPSGIATPRTAINGNKDEADEPQTLAPETRPKLKEVRRGVPSHSEALLPQSSAIMAEGSIAQFRSGTQTPAPDEEAKSDDVPEERHESADEPSTPQDEFQPSALSQEGGNNRQYPDANGVRPESNVEQAPNTELGKPGSNQQAQAEHTPPSAEIPSIKVHQSPESQTPDEEVDRQHKATIQQSNPSPSSPSMAKPDSDTAILSKTPAPPSPDREKPKLAQDNETQQGVAEQSNSNNDQRPVKAPPETAAIKLPHIQAASQTLGADQQPERHSDEQAIEPEQTPAPRVKKRQRAVRKARSVMLKRPILNAMLGREIGGMVHPLLNQH